MLDLVRLSSKPFAVVRTASLLRTASSCVNARFFRTRFDLVFDQSRNAFLCLSRSQLLLLRNGQFISSLECAAGQHADEGHRSQGEHPFVLLETRIVDSR